MGIDDHEAQQRINLAAALRAAYISPGDLWLKFFSIGGSVGEYEVNAYLQGMLSLPPLQRDLLAHAANELIADIPPLPRATYAHDEEDAVRNPGPDTDNPDPDHPDPTT